VLVFLVWWLSAADLSSDEQGDPRAREMEEDEDEEEEPRLSGPYPRSLSTGMSELVEHPSSHSLGGES
jgi:hypothetical protein